jgi:hypothetical protein
MLENKTNFAAADINKAALTMNEPEMRIYTSNNETSSQSAKLLN